MADLEKKVHIETRNEYRALQMTEKSMNSTNISS